MYDMARSIAYFLSLLFISSLILACQPMQTEQFTILESISTSISSQSDTPSSTNTKTSTPVPPTTPSPTPNPFGTQISSVKWSEEGDLSQPVDIYVDFGESLDDLSSGSYLLYMDSTTRGLHYTSLDGSNKPTIRVVISLLRNVATENGGLKAKSIP